MIYKDFIFIFLSTLIASISASAYIDPGSNSLLIQMLLGGFAGLILFFRTLFMRLKTKQQSKEVDIDLADSTPKEITENQQQS